MFRRVRDAVTGRYTSKDAATANPATTVTETATFTSPAALGAYLAGIADKASGTDMPGEAYSQNPDLWNAEASRLIHWLHG